MARDPLSALSLGLHQVSVGVHSDGCTGEKRSPVCSEASKDTRSATVVQGLISCASGFWQGSGITSYS